MTFAPAAVAPLFAAAALVAARVAATLGWSPGVFWGATPADLRAALGLDLDLAPPAASPDLARLMEAFPDEPTAR
jgi:hypothetical protein